MLATVAMAYTLNAVYRVPKELKIVHYYVVRLRFPEDLKSRDGTVVSAPNDEPELVYLTKHFGKKTELAWMTETEIHRYGWKKWEANSVEEADLRLQKDFFTLCYREKTRTYGSAMLVPTDGYILVTRRALLHGEVDTYMMAEKNNFTCSSTVVYTNPPSAIYWTHYPAYASRFHCVERPYLVFLLAYAKARDKMTNRPHPFDYTFTYEHDATAEEVFLHHSDNVLTPYLSAAMEGGCPAIDPNAPLPPLSEDSAPVPASLEVTNSTLRVLQDSSSSTAVERVPPTLSPLVDAKVLYCSEAMDDSEKENEDPNCSTPNWKEILGDWETDGVEFEVSSAWDDPTFESASSRLLFGGPSDLFLEDLDGST